MIEYRILEKKLLFLHHLATLPEDTLAREVFEVQKKLALPGLVQECQQFLVRFGITCVGQYTKLQWKRLIKGKIAEMNKDDILHQIRSSYTTLNYEQYAKDTFKRKSYLAALNISEARMRFKINAGMTPTVKMNFPSDVGFANQLWTCAGCTDGEIGGEVAGCRDTQQHVLICPGYAELRQDKNLDDDRDLVHYFSQVIKRRLASDNV